MIKKNVLKFNNENEMDMQRGCNIIGVVEDSTPGNTAHFHGQVPPFGYLMVAI